MNTKKQWIAMLLMLAMLFTALPIAAFAEGEPEAPAVEEQEESTPPEAEAQPAEAEEEQLEIEEQPAMEPVQMGDPGSEEEENMGSLTVQWDYSVPGKGFYNPEDKGNKVTLNFWLRAEGTGEDGNITKFWFMYNPDTGEFDKPTTVEIGKKYSHKFSLNEIQSSKGETFKNCKLIAHDVDIDSNNRIYGAGNSTSEETPNDRVLYVIQNMETKTILEIEPGSIILEDDRENMMVHYWVEKSRDGSTPERVKNNRQRKEFTESRLFIKGDLDFLDGTNKERTSFRYGVIQNQFGQFSPFVKGKTDFFLGAEWADGEHKPDLDKRYTLERTGDDLTGWTFTLKSKIKEKKVEKASEEIPFDTDEIEDSTLPEGTRKVIQQGVNGTKITYAVSYYVKDANGREETVKDLGEKIEVTEPVKQIVHVGTKKVTPSTPSVPSAEYVDIIFDANEGAWANGETRREYRSAVGSVITIESAPTREGYKFLYWKGSEFHPGENYTVPAGGHTFVAQWEKVEKKPEDKPSAPSVDAKIKTPRGSALNAEEIAKILASTKRVIPAIPKAGVGR